MIDLGRLLERIAFHLPYSHDWLAEPDGLRNRSHQLEGDLARVEEEKSAVQARLDQVTSALWQPPGHFYSPIPDVVELRANFEKVFSPSYHIPDVDFNTEHQLELLDQFLEWYREQPFTPDKTPDRRFYQENPYFSYTDSLILYCMMRRLRPRRIIEVGSGFSSSVMLDVNDAYFDGSIELTFIEPYPDRLLTLMTDADRSKARLLVEKVQDVDTRIFQDLGMNDILFIDSSHVSKTGSDLNHLLFKIFPLLNDGVMIHFHDIFIPFEYPESWAFEGRSWNEVYLLHAFLAHNRSYQIEFFNNYVIDRYPERIAADFPLFLKNPGGSLWLRKVGEGRPEK